jgi:hypothetical protein
MSKVFDFDLKTKTQTITVTDTDSQKKEFTISELSGEEMEAYMESMKDRLVVSVDDKGNTKTTLNSFKGMYAHLLTMCLRDEAGKLIAFDRIQKFPTSVQKGMFEIAQDLNGLDEKSAEKAKN